MNIENGKSGQTLGLTTLEKSVVSFLGFMAFGMLGWVVHTTNETSKDVVAMEASITFIQRDAEKAGADRFTGSQGRDLTRRVENVEDFIKEQRGS